MVDSFHETGVVTQTQVLVFNGQFSHQRESTLSSSGIRKLRFCVQRSLNLLEYKQLNAVLAQKYYAQCMKVVETF